jgi:hypothetical protein
VLILLGLILAAFYDFLFVMMISSKARNPAPKDSKVSRLVAISHAISATRNHRSFVILDARKIASFQVVESLKTTK